RGLAVRPDQRAKPGRGIAQAIEGRGHAVEARFVGDPRGDVDLSLAERAQRGVEVLRMRSAAELDREALGVRYGCEQAIRLETPARDHHARAVRRAARAHVE